MHKQPQLQGENAPGSPSTRSRSSSISSSDEAVTEPPAGLWSSSAVNSSTRQQASVGVGDGSAAGAGSGDALATSATRRGRVIKKPVRLEEQDPGRQTLPGRNGRADAPAKLAAQAAAAGPAQPGTAGGGAAAVSSANGKAGGQASGKDRAAAEEPAAAAGGGAERCVARLGTATSGGSAETGTKKAVQAAGSSDGKSGFEADKGSTGGAQSSSAADSVVRMAMPLERRTSGSASQGDAEEAGDAAGESSKKGKGSVRERDRLVVPDPPPERPVGGLGPAPDEAIKEYKRAFDDVREGVCDSNHHVVSATARQKRKKCIMP